MIARVALLLVSSVLCSCALNNSMLVQDRANTGLRVPEQTLPLTVTRDLRLSFTRGGLDSAFHAAVDAGSYEPVATSDAGTFYLAPYGAFAYGQGGATEARVGGLLRRTDGTVDVWVMMHGLTMKHWSIIKSGIWIRDAKQGFNNIATRPWVEPDFGFPLDAIQL